MRDFSRKTLNKLSSVGVSVIGICTIPNAASDMPFATGERGYKINDNGCHRIFTFSQVLELVQ